MKNLLYIGNALSIHGLNQTSIETLGPMLEKEGYNVAYASSKKNKILRMLDMIWLTLKNAKKTDYVLIDTYSTYNFWYAFVISQLCRILRVKYIMKLHGGNLPSRLNRNPVFCKMMFANALLNAAPSGYLLNAFVEAGFINTTFIPNVIELCNYDFLKREKIRPNILWVRSFSKIYNPEMAVYVFSMVKEVYPDAKLCMVGPDGGNFENVKELAAQLKVDIEFPGRLTKREWTDLSVDYDIFINTTHFDNTPVSVIEAMALGLAVVSTNVGGIPYLLEHQTSALLVGDDDTEAMVERIIELVQNNVLHKRLVENALESILDFDVEKVKFQWIKILC